MIKYTLRNGKRTIPIVGFSIKIKIDTYFYAELC